MRRQGMPRRPSAPMCAPCHTPPGQLKVWDLGFDPEPVRLAARHLRGPYREHAGRETFITTTHGRHVWTPTLYNSTNVCALPQATWFKVWGLGCGGTRPCAITAMRCVSFESAAFLSKVLCFFQKCCVSFKGAAFLSNSCCVSRRSSAPKCAPCHTPLGKG